MPWSADENRDWVLNNIKQNDTVLDVGAGAGIWADLLRGQVDGIDAVEIFEPYIERFGLTSKYGKIYLGDFKELALPTNVYDVVILGDVLEHFELEDAMIVWEKARTLVGEDGYVLLSSPIIDFPQGEEEGNIHEAHLSQFSMMELLELPGVFDGRAGEIIGSIIAYGKNPVVAEDLSVVITTIPTRQERRMIAHASVWNQTLRPQNIIIQTDNERVGAPLNRDRGLEQVETTWVAFLDDDDFFYPDHLEALYTAAIENDVDIVYSWFDVLGGTDPFPHNFGKPWDPENPVQTTVTILAKADVLRKAGGYTNTYGMSEEELAKYSQGNTAGEDFRLIYNANAQGAKILHVPKKTWAYCHWSGNTSGQPDRW